MNQLLHAGQVVATGAMLSEQLGCSESQLTKNFNNNKGRYIEGDHYYVLKGKKLDLYIQNLDSQISSKTRSLYLWTEKGAFNHVKSLGTDQAWDAFQNLVDTYFRVRAIADQVSIPNFADPVVAARAWADKAEEARLKDQRITLLLSEDLKKSGLIDQQAEKLAVTEPKAKVYDDILASYNTLTVDQIAKEIGLTAQALNKWLIAQKIQYKRREQYLLSAGYCGKGYTQVESTPIEHRDGRKETKSYTVWTQAGRLFIKSRYRAWRDGTNQLKLPASSFA